MHLHCKWEGEAELSNSAVQASYCDLAHRAFPVWLLACFGFALMLRCLLDFGLQSLEVVHFSRLATTSFAFSLRAHVAVVGRVKGTCLKRQV